MGTFLERHEVLGEVLFVLSIFVAAAVVVAVTLVLTP